MQVFKSMADVKSLILVGAVAARRFIHIEDLAFNNNATGNKLLNFKLFCGKYFDILYSSAESIRDANETQHLRSSKRRWFNPKFCKEKEGISFSRYLN